MSKQYLINGGNQKRPKKPPLPLELSGMPAASQDAEGGVATSTSPSHINTVRSLGLLHELQDYINSVESLTNEQKQELLRLREEKRDMERIARHHGNTNGHGVAVNLSSDFFKQSQIQELPPRLRAVLEDNKAMKEKLRVYKQRALASEHAATQKNSQIIVMENAIATLKQQLAACSRTPADVNNEEKMKSQLYASGRTVKNLEYEVNVLKQKVETDAKLHRQAMAASRREQAALEKKIILLNATIAEKDVELRKAHLEVKQLYRRFAPKRGQSSYVVSASLDELEAREYVQFIGETGLQSSPSPEQGLVEPQQAQEQQQGQQAEEQDGGQQGMWARENERALTSVLSLGADMSPGEPPQELQSQQEPQAPEEPGLGAAAVQAAEDAALPLVPVQDPAPGKGAAAEAEGLSASQVVDEQPPGAEWEGAGGQQEQRGVAAEEQAAQQEEVAPQHPVVDDPHAAVNAMPLDPAAQEEVQAAGDGGVPSRRDSGPDKSLHSAIPKPVPFRHTAAVRAKAQKKDPSSPSGQANSSPAAACAAPRPAKVPGPGSQPASNGTAADVAPGVDATTLEAHAQSGTTATTAAAEREPEQPPAGPANAPLAAAAESVQPPTGPAYAQPEGEATEPLEADENVGEQAAAVAAAAAAAFPSSDGGQAPVLVADPAADHGSRGDALTATPPMQSAETGSAAKVQAKEMPLGDQAGEPAEGLDAGGAAEPLGAGAEVEAGTGQLQELACGREAAAGPEPAAAAITLAEGGGLKTLGETAEHAGFSHVEEGEAGAEASA